MAVFYILPPRDEAGQHFQEFLASVFPGLLWHRGDCPDLAEALAQAAEGHPGVYVVFRDDLDESIGVAESVMRDFGGDLEDEIVVVRPRRAAPVVEVERLRMRECLKAA